MNGSAFFFCVPKKGYEQPSAILIVFPAEIIAVSCLPLFKHDGGRQPSHPANAHGRPPPQPRTRRPPTASTWRRRPTPAVTRCPSHCVQGDCRKIGKNCREKTTLSWFYYSLLATPFDASLNHQAHEQAGTNERHVMLPSSRSFCCRRTAEIN